MRYLVYSNTGLTSKQVGLTAEIVEKLKQQGATIRVVLCDNVLENCFFNRTHNALGCATCQSRLIKLLHLAGIKSSEISRLKHKNEVRDLRIPFFNNLEELKSFEYESINIGRGVASSIISYKRDYHLNSKKYGDLIDIEVKKSINVLLNFKNIINEFRPDEIYLFNGRFSEVHPLVELAKTKKIPFYSMEAGSGNNYELFKNYLPHSIKVREESILNYWESAESKRKIKTAKKWFESKREGVETYEKSFTQNQEKNKRPQNFDDKKLNIAIFNSSEDEMKVMEEWETTLFKNQNDAIRQIVTHYENNERIHFYLRIHPNLGGVKNIQMDEIKQMNFKNLTIIPPDSNIDTYSLLDNCDKVITFGSSVGIEATYWGKPSILYGRCFYMNLDVAYVPQSFSELCNLIEKDSLPPKDQNNTLSYGFYMSEYGYKTSSFKFGGLKNSMFKKHRIRIFYLNSIPLFLRYLKRLPLWMRLHKIYYNEKFGLKSIKKYK